MSRYTPFNRPAAQRSALLCAVLLLTAACAQRGNLDDPAYGGFFNGIENISDGTYDARIATREERVAALQHRQQRLLAERNSLSRQVSAHQNALARLQQDIIVSKIRIGEQNIPQQTQARISAALNPPPSGQTDAERLANLQKTIADTRKLAESLAKLAG
ncbi:hypothetical protein [Neptunicoccus sediminis]|uniref:hypothetical protein n=1 Tax=Neptunicoccus sediminis TaxID=1892596 RepID=UPI000845C0FC|nr:hypothetical protein [Neptunicoccus sediminis]